MTNPDKPFQLHGGNSEQSSLHNRISCIDRMEYILKTKHNKVFSYRNQTSEWLMLWDMEMYQRWYKSYPKDYKIDEEFCQRGAEVANAMIEDEVDIKSSMVNVKERIAQSYKEYASTPLAPQKVILPEKKTWLQRLFRGKNAS